MPYSAAMTTLAPARRLPPRAILATTIVLAGALVAWTVYGLGAYGLYRLVVGIDHGFLDWDRAGPYVVGGAVALAGIYELTPPKSICPRDCRSPMHYVLGGLGG